MPGHHPVPSNAAHRSLLKPRREREALVDEVCARLSDKLDLAVVALKTLVQERDPELWRRVVPRTAPHRSAEA